MVFKIILKVLDRIRLVMAGSKMYEKYDGSGPLQDYQERVQNCKYMYVCKHLMQIKYNKKKSKALWFIIEVCY